MSVPARVLELVELFDRHHHIYRSDHYVLGLINSTLLFWNLRIISNKFRGDWITCTKQYVGTLPIRTVNFFDPVEKTQHDKIVELVGQLLSLHSRLTDARIPQAKTMLQQQITITDQQIDKLVYELYKLTKEEIAIVEEEIIDDNKQPEYLIIDDDLGRVMNQ